MTFHLDGLFPGLLFDGKKKYFIVTEAQETRISDSCGSNVGSAEYLEILYIGVRSHGT